MIETDNNPARIAREVHHISQEILAMARAEKPVAELVGKLANLRQEDLAIALEEDGARKSFWINIYNAFNLQLMKDDPKINSGSRTRMRHFMRRQIVVAGERLSLMNIENDLLRRGQLWWSLGYFRRPWTRPFIRRFRAATLDPRIHFALNCGAMSCPPIRFYKPEQIEAQLELATRGFMMTEVISPQKEPGVLRVSSIFRLYQGDFGGKSGIRDWIRRYRGDLDLKGMRLKWLPYDWTTDLDAFA